MLERTLLVWEIVGSGDLIRGRALIFWDLKIPGKNKKLDAIDTDQITPAADCVSESLETLDARWKAGSFRHLMPDFRERVHRGETFVVAGDRFAIGSSREMVNKVMQELTKGGYVTIHEKNLVINKKMTTIGNRVKITAKTTSPSSHPTVY